MEKLLPKKVRKKVMASQHKGNAKTGFLYGEDILQIWIQLTI